MILLKPIGFVRTEATDEDVKLRKVVSTIEILPEYEEGLKGIDGFSHLIVLCYFHRLREHEKGVLTVKPRRLLRYGFREEELPEVGVFALDSPARPNPIALSIVEFIGRRGRELQVKGLDAFNGTPVLDIKPYTPSRVVENLRFPRWFKKLMEKSPYR